MFTANVIANGAGVLHVPATPDFKGKDSFKGEAFHSAEWQKGYDPTGRTVAVIGTGASAVQIVPTIAPQVKKRAVKDVVQLKSVVLFTPENQKTEPRRTKKRGKKFMGSEPRAKGSPHFPSRYLNL